MSRVDLLTHLHTLSDGTFVCQVSEDDDYNRLQVSEDDDYNRQSGRHIGEVQPQDAWSIKFFQDSQLPCPKHDDEAAVAPLRVTIILAAHLTRTPPERMYVLGQLLQLPHQDLLRTRDVGVCPGGGLADPTRTLTSGALELPRYPARRGD